MAASKPPRSRLARLLRFGVFLIAACVILTAIGMLLSDSATEITPESETAWVTGISRCVGAADYGQLVLPTGINVWSGWGDNRGQTVGQVAHGQQVKILEGRQDTSMDDDRAYFKVETADGTAGWLSNWYIQFRPVSEGFDPIEDC